MKITLAELQEIIAEEVKAALEPVRADEGVIDEVTPKGYEKIVKGLKKSKGVKNPWAIAWSMKSKGIKPKKRSR